MKRTILTVPHTTLLATSHEVVFPLEQTDQELARDLYTLVETNPGSAGLAAPQVGELKRMIIITDKKRKPTLLINPVITMASRDTVYDNEGCLSIPNKLYRVGRSSIIRLTYQDVKGKTHEIKLRDWEARVAQHEIDHLNGILINMIGTETTAEE